MTRNEREDVGKARMPMSDSQTAREGIALGHATPSPDRFCLEREINMGGHDISGYEPTHDILRGQGEEANQCKWTMREDSPTTIDTMDSPPSSVHNAVVCKFPGPCPIPGTRKKGLGTSFITLRTAVLVSVHAYAIIRSVVEVVIVLCSNMRIRKPFFSRRQVAMVVWPW